MLSGGKNISMILDKRDAGIRGIRQEMPRRKNSIFIIF